MCGGLVSLFCCLIITTAQYDSYAGCGAGGANGAAVNGEDGSAGGEGGSGDRSKRESFHQPTRFAALRHLDSRAPVRTRCAGNFGNEVLICCQSELPSGCLLLCARFLAFQHISGQSLVHCCRTASAGARLITKHCSA